MPRELRHVGELQDFFQARLLQPLELPHIMLLIDDPAFTVIPGKAEGTIVYDTELMLGGGRLRGSLLGSEGIAQVQEALARLAADREEPLLFAVGDGNHSLATAKACATAQNPLSRHALVEVVNIHDPSLLFEPIYRVVFGVNPEELIAAAKRQFSGCTEHAVSCLFGGERDAFSVDGLAAGSLQTFLDAYLRDKKGASCDYIHGTAAVEKLSSAENAVGFLFDGIGKEELFRFVERSGSLPRKTFSMGEAQDKRYYMECRRIALP